MEFMTINEWDEAIWQYAKPIYQEAFGNHAKPEKIIQNMFAKGICQLHLASEETIPVGMALTGATLGSRILIIDYLAVRRIRRVQGIGREVFDYIKNWAVSQDNYDFMLLEVECENKPENLARIHFWEKCGFELKADYIHHYIWVPEPYQVMVLELGTDTGLSFSGKEWFEFIEAFHKKSFRQ